MNCGYFVSDLVKLAFALFRYLVLQIYYFYYCHCILIVEELATCIQISAEYVVNRKAWVTHRSYLLTI